MPIGNLYVISAPSGTGKTTLVKALVDSLPDVAVSISHTTRAKRPAEIHGINYHFIDEKEFLRMIDHHDFLEYARIFNHFYGTSKTWVEHMLARGIDVILEIDWQGAQQVQHLFSDSISIFILPPSLQSLSDRLFGRNQDDAEIIKQRLADVREASSHAHEYNYIVMNDVFETALEELKTIILAGRFLKKRQLEKYAKLLNELKEMC